jgi:hypothetical protein
MKKILFVLACLCAMGFRPSSGYHHVPHHSRSRPTPHAVMPLVLASRPHPSHNYEKECKDKGGQWENTGEGCMSHWECRLPAEKPSAP